MIFPTKFDYTNDDDMLPWNHLDPEQINDIEGEPMIFEDPPF